MKRTLLDDIEEIYFSLRCTSFVTCGRCKNKLICKITANLLKSLKKHYLCDKNYELCKKCNKINECEIIQKIY